MVPAAFQLRSSINDWQTYQDSAARATGLGIHFVDRPIVTGQRAPVRFTFFWGEDADYPLFRRRAHTWEGRNFTVGLKV